MRRILFNVVLAVLVTLAGIAAQQGTLQVGPDPTYAARNDNTRTGEASSRTKNANDDDDDEGSGPAIAGPKPPCPVGYTEIVKKNGKHKCKKIK